MNKHILITGGHKGIGLAATRIFLERNCRVTIIGRDFKGFALQNHPKVHTLTLDLAHVDEIPKAMQSIQTLDVLINNAGVMFQQPFDHYDPDIKARSLAVNLEAPVQLIQTLWPLLKKTQGRIVNVASIAGQIGHPDIWYGMTKAALINLTKTLARTLAPHQIVINAVAPGPTHTEMLGSIPKARLERIQKGTYTGKIASPEEIAQVMVWLALDSPAYLTGFCIDMNNGIYPR